MHARAARDLALGVAPLLAGAAATWRLFDLPASYLGVTGGLYLALAALVLATLPRALPGPGMGPANRITLLRATLVLVVTGLVACSGPLRDGLLWWVIAVSTLSMKLDGFDGWVARRTGTSTAFGARFDMELDAFLMLVLSVLVWESGKAGVWVVLIGLLRYLFVGAGLVWSPLTAPLPDSFRRKLVCVVQGVALLVALGPVIPAPVAAWLCAAALAALVYSFAVDVAWLVRRA